MATEQDVIITMRVLMAGKEIGGIIGKGGKTISDFREKSGSRIHISSQHNTTERIVTITGEQTQIHEAFGLICCKLEQDINAHVSTSATSKVPITVKLIVPASQCGSIIGKGGTKIKEIRDETACAIKVHSDMLPNSTERAVTLSGTPSAIVRCIDMLCDVMIQFPARTATVPYQPDSAPMLFQGQSPYVLPGQFSSRSEDGLSGGERSPPHSSGSVKDGSSGSFTLPSSRIINASTQELTVPNEKIGGIIGKGGSRINEIRSMSGAQIKIDKTVSKSDDRKITITGSAESISLAQYLINTSIQMFTNQSDKHTSLPPLADQSPRPLMSLYTCPTAPPMHHQPSLMGPAPFTGLYPAAAGFHGSNDSISLALQNAKRSFVSKTGSRSNRNFGNSRGRNNPKIKEEGEKTTNPNPDRNVANERKRSKRDKFSPY